jgi:hypothetical protein
MSHDYLGAVRRARDILSTIPGVFAVGVGYKITAGKDTGRLALNVMVLEKKPLASLRPDEIIPPEIEGLPTDVEAGAPPTLIVDTFCRDFNTGITADPAEHRPIIGGIRIRAASSRDFDQRPSFGTLGCFARSTGDEAGKKVLLSNYHVFEDAFHKINGPSCTGCSKGDAVGNPDVGSTVAHVLRGLDNDQLDAAIAVLDDGVQIEQRIIKDDDTTTGKEIINGTRPPLKQEVPADHNFAVHKRGHTTRITYGIVRVFGMDVDLAEPGRVRHKVNQIRIDLPSKLQQPAVIGLQSNGTITAPTLDFAAAQIHENDLFWTEGPVPLGPLRIIRVAQHELGVEGTVPDNPAANVGVFITPPHFALHGDSGSVLLDEHGLVVGLIWAANCKVRVGNAWANPIDQVESQLKIHIEPASTMEAAAPASNRPSGARDGTVDEHGGVGAPVVARDAAAFGNLRERVEQDLVPLPRGRLIHDLYFRHHMEVRELIDTNRRVATVWHRQSGPGMIQSVLDAVRSRTNPVAEDIRGASWSERVRAVLAIFHQFGSSSLKYDIAAFGRDIEGLGGMTYPAFLESLKG